jgi:hypothetical protein
MALTSRPHLAARVLVLAAGLAAMALTLAAPGAAQARGSYSDPLAEAVGRAVEYWEGTPCGGTVGVTMAPAAEAPRAGANAPGAPSPFAAMWATWTSPTGENMFTSPPASFTECVVHVNVGVWPTVQSEDALFPAFCKEILHEYGHFEGYPDVDQQPGTVEYERPDLAHVPLCESYVLHYGEKVYRGPPRHRRPRPG